MRPACNPRCAQPATLCAPGASPPPAEWTQGNPHYAYYCYYLYANLHALNQVSPNPNPNPAYPNPNPTYPSPNPSPHPNQLRARQGYSLLAFRPHAGEAVRVVRARASCG